MSSSDNLFENVLKNKIPPVNPAPAPTVMEAVVPDPVVDDSENEDVVEVAQSMPTEIDMLKSRARLMGVSFSNNIGLDALKAKVNAKLQGEAQQESQVQAQDETQGDDETQVDGKEGWEDTRKRLLAELEALGATPPGIRTRLNPRIRARSSVVKPTRRQEMYAEQMKLIRVRITNLNPAKKDLPGEIFTFANKVLGAVRKYIPYGATTDNGYHIPFCIYTQLKEREFQLIKTRKDNRGQTLVETGMAREFALEVLPTLTPVELARLAASQAAAKGMD